MTTHTQADERTGDSSMQSARERNRSIADDAKSMTDSAAHTAATVSEKVQEEAAHVAELAKDGFDRAKDMHASTCDKVKQHPTAAMLIALGAGVMLGRIFGGR